MFGSIVKQPNNGVIIRATDVLYHYTDINALVNILRDDNIVLRATNCLFLNDEREIEEGVTIVNDILGKSYSKYQFRNYYTTSFSGSEDNLMMWNMYAANGGGCAIGLNPEILQPSSSIFDFWTPCFYEKAPVEHILKTDLLSINSANFKVHFPSPSKPEEVNKEAEMTNAIIKACLSSKNKAFHEENEFRGVCYREDFSNDLKFRERKGVVIPFIELKIPKDALMKITIGPTNKSELAKMSILNLLKQRRYNLNKLDVVDSNVPFRA